MADTIIAAIGSVAAVFTVTCNLPQLIHTLRTRSTVGLSLWTYRMLLIGTSLWLVYGVLIHRPPIIVSNAFGVVTSSLVLISARRRQG